MDSTSDSLSVQVESNQDESFLFAMQLATAPVLPAVLKTAIELDLLETIAKAGPGGSLSTAEMEAQLTTVNNPEAPVILDRLCSLLASYSVLTCSLKENSDGCVERFYGLAPVCKFLTKNEGGMSLAPLLLMNHDKVLMESCKFESLTGHWLHLIISVPTQMETHHRYHLKDTVLDGGIPFNKAYGMSAFEFNGKDQRFNSVTNAGMFSHSTMTMKKIVDLYDGFDGLATLVDVGGGIGASLNMIISKHTTLKGINFDLPHVIEDAATYPGIEHVGGDMFESVPTGDAIFLKWILHNWSDAQCLKLLKNCYKALPDNGKVIVAEFILPEEAPDTTKATKNVIHMDVLMLALSEGGKERTEKDFETLANGAGFKGFRKAACAYNTWVMELCK